MADADAGRAWGTVASKLRSLHACPLATPVNCRARWNALRDTVHGGAELECLPSAGSRAAAKAMILEVEPMAASTATAPRAPHAVGCDCVSVTVHAFMLRVTAPMTSPSC